MNFRLLLFLLLISSCSNSQDSGLSEEPPNHQPFTVLLSKYVIGDQVDYNGLQSDSVSLNSYLSILSNNGPSDSWTKNARLAYWINAYNAFTLKLIIDHYPVSSITDLHPAIYIPMMNTVWHQKFFKIGGIEMSLDEIEHSILRKEFNEPRIHFAINCASVSCPPLRNEAYTPDDLEEQLNEQAKQFINDSKRNRITIDEIEISKIFSWFAKDFKKEGSLINYLNKYSNTPISESADINYMYYDWSLNDVK